MADVIRRTYDGEGGHWMEEVNIAGRYRAVKWVI